MKWFYKISFATVLTVSMTSTAFGAIQASEWAQESMQKAYQMDMIPEEMLSRGTENMTRKEFTVMAVQFYEKLTGEEIDISGIHNPFWDTDQKEIVFGYAKGIISGKQEHIFEPEQTMTREQMAILLVRTLEKAGVVLPEEKEEIVFQDTTELEEEVLPYIKKVQMAGIMNGFEDFFYPFSEVKVEEAVVAFTAIYDNIISEGYQKQPTENTQTEANTETNTETEPQINTENNIEPQINTETENNTELQTENNNKTDTKSNTEKGILINGKTITIGESVEQLQKDWGEPDRIDQNSYSLQRYVYLHGYSHFFMVSIKDDKVAEIFTNDMSFQYKGVTGKMDAADIKNIKYTDLMNFRVELQDEGNDTYILLSKDYKTEGILIRTSDYKQGLQLRYSQKFLEDYKLELLDIINSARVQEDFMELKSDETAENVAYYHSWDMSKNNYVGYTNLKGENPFDRMTSGGVKYSMAGESIVKIDGGDAIDTYHRLIMEAGTRTNILNPEMSRYGLGVFDANFTIYVTLDLFQPEKK